ncbi:slit homolog 1 protein-like [Centruroides sculpturatus]|uniref:slit homolog 1 protein-like n=1 Tax=Centruroides sculpturatus TaxID=218467 RepID=UPI000C6D5D48|nr:slit homolog 1 protein-like [Centruroides sculpturatus]
MRWVIFSQFLFLVVNSCQEFWQHWRNVSCTSLANSCHESKNFSRVEIFNQILSIECGEETIDSDLMRCLDVKNVQEIKFTYCFLSGIDFGIFTFGYGIEHVQIYNHFSHKRNFESASFNDMYSLRSVVIRHVKTSELLNVTFHNVPSLTSLRIKWYNFSLFSNKPFRELINLSELYIVDGELKALPEDIFYNLQNLTKLDLNDNKIESIHPLVFRNLTKLQFLDLGSNQIKYLPSDMIKGLSNLRIFSIHGNRKLSEIPSGFFKKMHNLTHFSGWGCSISSLEEDVFSDLINLKILYIDSNRIERLLPNLLRNNKRLAQFFCSFNKISTLPTGIFHGLSELRELRLEENRLENLPEDVFQNLSSLQRLRLSRNRLTCLYDNIFLPLTNLTHLDLSGNNLTEIIGEHPFGSSKHLTHLNLNNAGLTQWPVINWTEYNLRYVRFSHNHFETVKLPIYTPNRMITFLFDCKIRTIYLDEWKYGFQMPTYHLSNNEINCDDELQQFVSVFKSNMEVAKRIFPNIEKTKCFGEERNLLDNTSLVLIGNYCPIECDCSAQQFHVMVNCSGRRIGGFHKILRRIPKVLVPNATIVDLSNNYIQELSNVDCVTWKNVTHLRLTNNSISNISDYFFLSNVKFLWLDGNRLTELPSGLMNLIDVSPKFQIYLSRNNWNCHCHSQFTKDWLLRNRQKIADFSNIFCVGFNSSSVSFIEILSNDRCKQIRNDNLTSSIDVPSDEVSSVLKWKIAVSVFTSLMLLGVIIVAFFAYCRRKESVEKVSKTKDEEVIYHNVYT